MMRKEARPRGVRDPVTGLSFKVAAFVQEYLIDLNGTQAAVRAGYSPRTAKTQGSFLLTKPDVQLALQKFAAARTERTQIDQDWVLDNLRANMVGAMSEGDRSAANRALELLGRHLRMFPADTHINVDNRKQVVNYVIGKGY